MSFSMRNALAKAGSFLCQLVEGQAQEAFLWAPVALGLGIAFYFAVPFEPSPFEAMCVFAVAGAFGWFIGRKGGGAQLGGRALTLAALGFFAAAASSFFYGTPMIDAPLGPVMVRGLVTQVEQRPSGVRLLIERPEIEGLSPEQTPRRVHLTVTHRLIARYGAAEPGQTIKALARLMPLSEPLVPGGFDFRRHGYFQGLGATGYALGKIELGVEEGGSQSLQLWFSRLRFRMQREVLRAMDGDAAGLAIIMLTGDKSFLSPEASDAMRSVGLAHLLAIAGLHVGIVGGFVFFFLRAFLALWPALALRAPIKKIAAGVALLAIVFYTLQVGAPVPTRRALLMAGAVLLGVMTDRIGLSMRSLALAALALLLLWPFMLLSPGFQLSFAAVGALIAAGEIVRAARAKKRDKEERAPRPSWGGKVGHFGLELAGSSFVAAFATLPFSLTHFGEAEPYSVLANTLAIPLTTFWLMPSVVLVYLLWPFGWAGAGLALLKPGVGALIALSQKIAGLPYAHLRPPTLPLGLLALATFGLLFFCFEARRMRFAGLGIMALAVLLGLLAPRPFAFVATDGRSFGWAAPPVMLVASLKKPDAFLAGEWAAQEGLAKDAVAFVDQESAAPPLLCDPSACAGMRAQGRIVWVKNPEALPTLCADKPLAVINFSDERGCEDPAVALLTRRSFFLHGAHALYEREGRIFFKAARAQARARPWDVGWGREERALPPPSSKDLLWP